MLIRNIIIIKFDGVYASGPRGDSPDDSNSEGARCWVDDYDAGFSRKYDKELNKEKQKMMLLQIKRKVLIFR